MARRQSTSSTLILSSKRAKADQFFSSSISSNSNAFRALGPWVKRTRSARKPRIRLSITNQRYVILFSTIYSIPVRSLHRSTSVSIELRSIVLIFFGSNLVQRCNSPHFGVAHWLKLGLKTVGRSVYSGRNPKSTRSRYQQCRERCRARLGIT